MKTLGRIALALASLIIALTPCVAVQDEPVRIGVAGLTHGHVDWILGREQQDDIQVVGIFEPNRQLAEQYSKRFGFPMQLVYGNLEEMLEEVKPEAVTAFNSIYEHLAVVEACAPRGIHVMVEKPLAVSMEHARKMSELARAHGIHLLTNYETTWYASTEEAYRRVHIEREIGEIRKIVVHDGHSGPKEIGVGPEFLAWLTDPGMNGGGASIDFGCYGANLITWLMKGEKPTSVTAVFQQMKPEIYAEVDDEATILITYPRTQGIIQASWNWPFSRKDLEVYGQTGYVNTRDSKRMRIRLKGATSEEEIEAHHSEGAYRDPFSFLAAVVRGKHTVAATDLSALDTNVTVVQILEAARISASQGKTVLLK
ncbi:MAG TPA: Gfo/Idh/MocA family oxidoreductase [Acidobacteriota bacterium]|nr:Gfo/Idh/MocA family oxidoreductase [Acidobacteriota bacterium]